MRLSLYPDQRLTWESLQQDCRSAEADGWDGVWMCDHFIRPKDEPPGYFLECWTMIAVLAAQLPHITVGSLVSPTSLRHPGVLAITAATVHQISQGRLVLGIGAGGDAEEHEALGVPFLPSTDRIEALAEACAAVRGLLSPGAADFDGAHYRLRLRDTGLSASLQVPILVGAAGPRGIDVAARYADIWAIWGAPSELAAGGRLLDEGCRRYGRDPANVRHAAIVMLDAGDQAGLWPATLPADSRKLRHVLSRYRDASVDELIVCDFALPRTARSAILRQLRNDVLAWSNETDGL